jgi:CubicO group peptidase (beta-lactamase class C family)
MAYSILADSRIARLRSSIARLAVPILACLAACGDRDEAVAPDEFQAAYSLQRNQLQHDRFPQDNIWWTAYGQDQEWNFRNVHQFFPTVNVYRGGQVSELSYNPNPAIANHPVDTPAGPMTFDDFLQSDLSTAMGVVVLHKGQIAYERYPRMQGYEMPVHWSVAKQFVGSIVRILEERGEVDVSLPIEHYIPEVSESDFAGITVRNILDMATGLDCDDGDYSDRDSCYYRYSMTIGDGFRTSDAQDNPYDFVANLRGTRLLEQGQEYSYSGLNTFVLAWMVEKITAMSFQDVLSKEVWQHIGAESNASYIAPRYGIPMTHGGFLARLRDVARYGLLFTPSYSAISDRKIISDEHIEFLWSGGRPELRTNGGASSTDETGIKHNIYQWDAIRTNGDYYKGGWAGQGFMVNPQRDLVVVYVSYKKLDESEIRLGPTLFAVLESVYGDSSE